MLSGIDFTKLERRKKCMPEQTEIRSLFYIIMSSTC